MLGKRKHMHKVLAMRERLTAKNEYTIFASNCIGGVLYSDLGWKFLSPTVNMFMVAEDFLRFCKNYETYIDMKMKEIPSKEKYPVAMLGDITLHLVHYSSVEEAQKIWDRRKERINKNHICING